MNRIEKKLHRRKRIRQGIRKRVTGSEERPRLSIFRSNTSIYAQIINDTDGVTLVSASSKNLDADLKATKVEQAVLVGKMLAERANQANVKRVVFDRNGYLYHGRVKALAEGAREGGLDF
ncbi:MAG: 50S ribosomal protein L18 [Bacteroidota bacterium]|nr:50S ribosomal protein L18 [Bacteroidota bacterium]